jgi:prepilin-type processing-associated H-X9-DG protein
LTACSKLTGSEGIPGTVRGWHGKDWTFNAAFIDGHVGTIHMRGYDIPRVFQDDDTQARSTCIIVHGEGWQLATGPLPATPTGLQWSGNGRVSSEGGIE